MSADKDPDNLCNYLMIIFPRADNVFVIAYCCLCIFSWFEETGMVFICVKNWFMKPFPCGRWSNTLENFVTKSILNSWKELTFFFFFLAGL